MTTTAPRRDRRPLNPRSRVITASLVGTTIEFYDFYVYATAAVLVFPILFFPTGNDTTAAARVVRRLRRRDDRAPARRRRLRPLRRPVRPQGDARRVAAHDGYRDLPDRVPADLPADRLVGGAAAARSCASRRASRSAASGRAPRSSRPRTRRPASAPGTARSRSSAHRSASSSPTACSSRSTSLLPHPDGTGQRSRGVPRVGMARAVPVLGRDGHHRPLGATAPRRVRDLREGAEEQGAHPQVPARQR